MKESLNILLVCEHASSKFGGEAILPLNYFKFLSKTNHTPFLITHERVKKEIESDPEINKEAVFYIPDTKIHVFLNNISNHLPDRVNGVTVGFLMHLVSQVYQWIITRKVIKAKNIDVVHESAPVSATQPSAMFALGVPVIIGPMNGGMTFPKAFSHMSGKVERILYWILPAVSAIYNVIIPGKLFASILLYANERTHKSLPKLRVGETYELVENGTFTVKSAPTKSLKVKELNVLYVGRLVDWKVIDIAIDAVASSETDAKLTIVGDGVERLNLENYVNHKKLTSVTFTGQVPHAEVNQHYDDADIFILPSVRECGGAVVLEAMSRGLPVIATNWGGPADYITADTGFLVDPKSREYMIETFASFIDQLSVNPDLRYKIGLAAIDRVKNHFLWTGKVQDINKFYNKVVK